MIGELPRELIVNGHARPIRPEYTAALTIFQAMADPELSEREKGIVMLDCLYVDFAQLTAEDIEEAMRQAVWFLDGGGLEESKAGGPGRRVFDWEQDERIIFSAINKVAGYEVRNQENLHWWTFLGYFYEIGDGLFSQVLSIRQKKAKGKKLEKWEQEFYRNNRQLCDLRKRYTAEEQAEIDYWNKLLG